MRTARETSGDQLAVPAAAAWAGFLTWYSTEVAVRRLESHGPEIFTRVRSAAT